MSVSANKPSAAQRLHLVGAKGDQSTQPDAARAHLVFVQQYEENAQAVARELAAGLLASSAYLSPKFLYDQLGSVLFEAITHLPEYYPTRTEAAIMQTHLREIAASIGAGACLIDLGAGSCEKAARLFDALRPGHYVAVDISVDYLRETLLRLQQQWPELPMLGLGADFSQQLNLPDLVPRRKRVFFYPGSSIGNFSPDQAGALLRQLAAAAGKGGQLLIGIDLIKDTATLQAAYDDPLQVTAAFNRNLLLHINRLLDADFVLDDFEHVALFNQTESRIEMHLRARRELIVRWKAAGGGERRFASTESIHTENSYKYTPLTAKALLRASGFEVQHFWTDPQKWFGVFLAQAV